MLVIGYLGCNIELVLLTWFLAVTLITAAYAGAMASVVDIAPNLAGIGRTLLQHTFTSIELIDVESEREGGKSNRA